MCVYLSISLKMTDKDWFLTFKVYEQKNIHLDLMCIDIV